MPADKLLVSRRHFVERFMLGAAALAIDPERLLWTPKSMIVVPAMPARYRSWKSFVGRSGLLTPAWIPITHGSEPVLTGYHVVTVEQEAYALDGPWRDVEPIRYAKPYQDA